MDDYDEVYRTICRVCLAPYNHDTVSLIDEESATKLSCYGQAVLAFAKVSITPLDGFPAQMCYGCLYLLRQAIRFKLTCEQTHKHLAGIVLNSTNGDLKRNVVELSLYHEYLSKGSDVDDNNKKSGKELKPSKKLMKNCVIEIDNRTKSNDKVFDDNCNLESNSEGENDNRFPRDDDEDATEQKHEKTIKKNYETVDYDGLLNQLELLVDKKELKKKKRKIEHNKRLTKLKTKGGNLKEEINAQKHVKLEDNNKNDTFITLQDLMDETEHPQSEEDVLNSIEKVIDSMESTEKITTDEDENMKLKYYDRRKRRRRILNPDDGENNCQSNREKKKLKTKANVPQQCNVCNKMLANAASLLAHVKRHKQHEYICEHCGKSTTTNAELQSHLVARHGTGRYMQCDVCDFKTFRKYDMSEHARTHTGDRPFACDKCGLTFARQSVWRRHRRYHMEKRYTCPLCPRRFHFRGHMNMHSNNVHSRQFMYSCPRCGAVYAKPSTVRRHLLDKHNVPREEQGKITKIKRGEPGANFADH